MLEVLLLAVALAMDAFAVSIGFGMGDTNKSAQPHITPIEKHNKQAKKLAQLTQLALWSGLYFGMAQGIMPLFGHVFGLVFLEKFATYAPFIGGIILCSLGAKMGFDALADCLKSTNKTQIPEDNIRHNKTNHSNVRQDVLSHKRLLTLAIATSIDAMAAGFTLSLLALPAGLTCLIIAVITGGLSVMGVYVGNYFGQKFEQYAQGFGAVVLVGIGIHMMW